MHHGVHAKGGEGPIHSACDAINALGHQVGQPGPHHVEGEVEDGQHDGKEHRQGQHLVGEQPVNGHAALALAALLVVAHAALTQLLDEGVAHVGQGLVAVHAAVGLHLHHAVLNQLPLVFIKPQVHGQGLVALDQLGGRKAAGEAVLLGVVFNHVADGVDAAVHRARAAEVHPLGQDALLRHPLGLVQ